MSTEFVVIEWAGDGQGYGLNSSRGTYVRYEKPEAIVLAAYARGVSVRVNQFMPEERLAPILREVASKGYKLFDLNGAVVVNVRYITRAQIGRVIPEGWFIEQQGSRYAACHGEDMTLPYRTSMERALLDIYAFLAAVTAQSSSELVTCIAARLEQQDSFW